MKIKEFSPLDFSKLESQWKELQKGTEMTCFQTYDWYKIINAHFIEEKKKAMFRFGTYVLVSDDDDKPLLIAPIQVIKRGFYFKGVGLRKGFYFIGRQGFSDYLNFVYNDFKDEYLIELFNYLKATYSMNFFCFENISSRCASYRFLNDTYNPERLDSLCMSIDLPDDYNDYYKKWTQNMRHGINQAHHRMERDNMNFSYEIVHHLDDDLADELDEIRLQRLKKKQDECYAALSKKARIYTKIRDYITEKTSSPVNILKETDECWCIISRCNGETAAFFYFLYKPENKTLYSVWLGTNEKYNRYKPGMTQLVDFIEKEINDGKPNVEFVDLTRGNERYKYDLKADELVTSQFTFSI